MTAPQEASRAAFEALHQQILNLPCKYEAAWQMPNPSDWIEGYVNGHRDTRHAAAELVAAATAAREDEVRGLREALRELHEAECAEYPPAEAGMTAQTAWVMRKANAHEKARAALKENQP